MSGLVNFLQGMNEHDRSFAFVDYMKSKAWEMGIPQTGTFELTPRCTLSCKMCYMHMKCVHSDVEADRWLAWMNSAYDQGMMYATLTGGECMLHPGFK